VFLFHTGARKLEPAAVTKADMTVDDAAVYVNIPAFKHGERAGPLRIRRDLVGMQWVVRQYQAVKQKNRQLWPLSSTGAYRVVHDALGVCPHWLRHNWITTAQQLLDGTAQTVDMKIQSWTGIKTRATLDNYRLKQEKDIADVSEIGV
jgi:integrase